MGIGNSKISQIVQMHECLIQNLVEKIQNLEDITEKLSEEIDIIKKEMQEWEDYEEKSTEQATLLCSHQIDEETINS